MTSRILRQSIFELLEIVELAMELCKLEDHQIAFREFPMCGGYKVCFLGMVNNLSIGILMHICLASHGMEWMTIPYYSFVLTTNG